MSISLQDAVRLAGSEKLKERAAGFEEYRRIFKSKAVGEKLSANEDEGKEGARWIRVMEPLFACVQNDKQACLKKPTTVMSKRVKESANMVRWMVEGHAEIWAPKVVLFTLNHLAQMLDHAGRLFEPVALDYLKALRAILSCDAHVEHFDQDRWCMASALCFNIILHDNLKQAFDIPDDGDHHIDVNAGAPDEDGDATMTSGASSSNIRFLARPEDVEEMLSLEKLMSVSVAPLVTDARLGVRALCKYARFLDLYRTDSSAHLPALTGLNYVLAALEHNEQASVYRFAVRCWERLLALWSTKNRGLKEQLIITMRILLPFISQPQPRSSQTAATSAAALAEEQLISYTLVSNLRSAIIGECQNRWGLQPLSASNFDFVIDDARLQGVFDYASVRPGRVFGAGPALSWAALELAADVTFRLSKIPTPSSQVETEVTAVDTLPDPSGASSARGETPARAGSSRAAALRTSSTSPVKPSGTATTSATQRATKRRKLRSGGDDADSSCDPVNDLLLGLNSPAGQLTDTAVAARTWRIQTLLFIVLRHWQALQGDVREKMLQTLVESLSNDDGDVQFWNMITLAAAAYQTGVELTHDATTTTPLSSVWSQVWPVACRRTTLPSTSRASAHVAVAILRANLVPRAAALSEVQSLLSDFDLQGPPFPFDSVCAFLSAALALAGTDPALAGKRLEERVANWLLTTWSPLEGTTRGFKARTKLEEHDPVDVVLLLASLCRLPRLPRLKRAKALLPSCAIVEHVEREREGAAIRAYLLNCQVINPSQRTLASASSSTTTAAASFELDASIEKRGLEPFEQRWVKFLERALAAFEEEWREPAEGSGLVNLSLASTYEQARRTVDMAVLVLLFDATLSLNYVSTAVNSANSLTGIAARLLTLMADVAAQLRWSINDRAAVLKGFEPLLPSHDQGASPVAAQVSEALVSAGQLSDVRREVLFQQQQQRTSNSSAGASAVVEDLSLYSLVWQKFDLSESVLEHLRKAFELVTGGKTIMAEEARAAARLTNADDALWDNIRSNEADQMGGGGGSGEAGDNHNAIQAVVELCVGALADVPRLRQQQRGGKELASLHGQSSSETATTDKQLSACLVDGPIARIETALSTVARAFAEGRLHLSQRTLNGLLGVLGDSILPTYSFSHSEHAQLISLDFVEATMRAWMDPAAQGSDLVDRSERCAAYFAKQLQNTRKKNVPKGPMQTQWRVRVRLAALLERILIRSADADGASAWKAKRPPLKVESIVSVLLQLTEDDDMRVRFAASTAVGRLFEIVAPHRMPSADVWVELEETSKVDMPDTQRMLSRVLKLGNVLVACAAWRHEVLYHIVGLAMCSGDGHDAILAVLEACAVRLGFAHLRDLWFHFAGHVLWQMGRDEQEFDLLKLPFQVFGYRSRKENVEHTFRPVASMLLADAQPHGLEKFESLVGIMRKSNYEAKRECFHFVVAIELKFAGDEIFKKKKGAPPPTDEEYANLWGGICQTLEERWECESTQDVEDMVANVADQIVISLLHNAYEANVEHDGGAALLETLRDIDQPTAETLKALFVAPRGGIERVPYQPAAIVCSALHVYHGLRILSQSSIDMTAQGVAYHVIQQMLSHIHAERLVNDQARMMYALKIYIALSREGITSSTVLLGALLHGCTALLGLLDLFDMAVGVLEWALRAAAECTPSVPGLPGIFVSIVEQAERYTLHEDERARQAGLHLYEWLDVLVPELLESSAEDQIRGALYAWPRDHSASFADRVHKPSLEDLTLTIKRLTPTSSLNTRTLMRLCEALAKSSEAEKARFVSGTIWRLLGSQKNAIVSSGSNAAAMRKVNATRAEAVAQILSTCEGQLHTPRTDTLEESGADHVQMYWLDPDVDGADEDPTGSLKTSLFLVVLRALRTSQALDRIPLVLSRLRAILTIHKDFARLRAKWPDHTRQELDYIGTFPTAAIIPPRRSLSELDRTEATQQAEKFAGWICYVAALLCDSLASIDDASIYGQLSPLVASDADLAEKLFATLLHAALYNDWLYTENKQVDRTRLSNYFTRILKHEKASRRAWSAIVDAVLHLRRFSFDETPLGSDRWLSVDFLLLAQRARDCRLYASALLFVELAKEHAPGGKFDSSDRRVSELLYSIYSNTEDPDSFYAIKNPDLRASLVRRLHHEGQWSRTFEMHAADYESLPAARTQGAQIGSSTQANMSLDVNLSLHEMGFNRLALMLGQTQQSGDRADISYDVAWRSANWDLPTSSGGASGTSRGVFAALRAVHRERDPNAVTSSVASALESELAGLCEVGIEANTLARRVSRDLLSLHQVSEWCNCVKTLGDSHAAVQQLEHSWTSLSDSFEFADFERILAVRQSLLRSARQRSQANEIGAGLAEAVSIDAARLERQLLLRLSQGAREQGKLQTAMGAVTLAQHLDHEQLQPDDWRPSRQGSRYLSEAVSEEFANVLWAQGEHVIAIQALDEIVVHSTKAGLDQTARHALSLAQLGQWRATARSDQPRAIMETYFQTAWQTVLKQQSTVEEQAKVAHDYAVFADQQYRSIASSDAMRKLEMFVRDRTEEITLADAELSVLRPRHRAHQLDPIQTERYRLLGQQRSAANKILGFDKAQLMQHRTSQRLFRSHAVAMYAAALTAVDKYDDDITRLTSLWFEHADNEEFNRQHHDDLLNIPSRKFLSLTHQISSRLTKSAPSARSTPAAGSSYTPSYEAFNTNVRTVMTSMCRDHPFHALYSIYALRKGASDEVRSVGGSQSRGASQVSNSPQQLRGAAAEEIMATLKTNEVLRQRIIDWERVCNAGVEWAEWPLNKGDVSKSEKKLPSSKLLIGRLKEVPVPVFTRDLPIDPTCQYASFVSIARFGSTYKTAGGIHVPKIIDCIGSDGKHYPQLYKADDDLRQDAVMQQVFGLVNELLTKDRAARKRQLRVRTYAVIPLGPQCGLMEFVSNTSPLCDPILNSHARYPTGNIDPAEARDIMNSRRTASDDVKVETWRDLAARMPPTFHYYFMEQHKLPLAWLGTRLNYTRSVAVTSIVGHMLGIGDRHVSNILLDNRTGEVVHIDFGVAFEQGKLLPMPELIPFRLTRDVVDGMGLSGTEGVFRRSCEETLRVLREGADVIKTVLEVFKYDPLWAWASNPIKVLKAQAAGDDDVDALNARMGNENGGGGRGTAELQAERAINSVMAKLSTSLSVEYTVNDLIQQATDPALLGLLFAGWQSLL